MRHRPRLKASGGCPSAATDSTGVSLRSYLDEVVENKPRRRHSINMLRVFVSREVAQSTGQRLDISHPKQVIDVVARTGRCLPGRACSKPCKVSRRVHWTEGGQRKPWSSSCWSLFYLRLFGRNDHFYTSIAFLSIYRANRSVLDCLPSPGGGVSRRPSAACRLLGAANAQWLASSRQRLLRQDDGKKGSPQVGDCGWGRF